MTQAVTTQAPELAGVAVAVEGATRPAAVEAFLSRYGAEGVAAEPWGKRAAEVAAVLFSAPLWLPVLGLLTLAVRLDSKGPSWYAHRRYGRGGEMFTLWKLRTMAVGADEALPGILAGCDAQSAEWDAHVKLRRDPRLTRLGRWLRRSSLDELPQLLNVLRGEMSLVGPRPIPEVERLRYGRSFAAYCRVRPGVTGLWQVSGRNALTYDERVALDRRYVRSRSWRMELGVLARTFRAVWSGRGAY